MLLDLLETYVSEEETIRIIAEQIINGESDLLISKYVIL